MHLPIVPTTTLLWALLNRLIACAGTVEKCAKLREKVIQVQMIRLRKEFFAAKKILMRSTLRRAAIILA